MSSMFTVIPAPAGWQRAIVAVTDQDTADEVNALDPACTDKAEPFEAFLTEPPRPIVAWVVTGGETVGLTPGEGVEDALDAVERGLGDFVAHVSPDGKWITATETFTSQEAFFEVLRREAEGKARLAKLKAAAAAAQAARGKLDQAIVGKTVTAVERLPASSMNSASKLYGASTVSAGR